MTNDDDGDGDDGYDDDDDISIGGVELLGHKANGLNFNATRGVRLFGSCAQRVK